MSDWSWLVPGEVRPDAPLGRLPRNKTADGKRVVFSHAVRLSRLLLEDPSTGCWVHQGYRTKANYAQFFLHSTSSIGAHRLAWALTNGPVPDGLTVDHICYNPPCCNPSHLRLLTSAENSANRLSKFWTHCGNGHERTPENTNPQGDCRACVTAGSHAYRRRTAGATGVCDFCGAEMLRRSLSTHRRRHRVRLLAGAA